MNGHLWIRFLTSFIPSRSLRRRVRAEWLRKVRDARVARALPEIRARYASRLRHIRDRLARGERIRVSFLICDDAMFTGESVFLALCKDPRFECVVSIAPRVTRGEAFLREKLQASARSLTEKYGSERIEVLYDPDTGRRREVDADLIFSSVLYEDQSFPEFTVENLSRRALVVILTYGYGGMFKVDLKQMVFLPNLVWSWRLVVSNEPTRRLWAETNPLLAETMVTCGYAKMDRYEAVNARTSREGGRQTVMICAHHSLERETSGLHISTFLRNADLYRRLPDMFPEIDFIFNPHPLLLPKLRMSKWWGSERTDAYFSELKAHANLTFMTGDYFSAFARSDALIHDCGSFLAEYFYTGKPQCYSLETKESIEEQFLPFSRALLAHTYQAYSPDDIIAFIREVVIGGNDSGKAERDVFAAQTVCVNHPHAADAVVKSVIEALDSAKPSGEEPLIQL